VLDRRIAWPESVYQIEREFAGEGHAARGDQFAIKAGSCAGGLDVQFSVAPFQELAGDGASRVDGPGRLDWRVWGEAPWPCWSRILSLHQQ
jgi:hypothetical protein